MNINVDRELITMDGEPIFLDLSQEKVIEIQAELAETSTDQESPVFQMEFLRRMKSKKKPLTLKSALIESLMQPSADQEASVTNFTLAQAIAKGGDVDLSTDQIVTLKKLLATRYANIEKGDDGKTKKSEPITLIVGQACMMLEGNA